MIDYSIYPLPEDVKIELMKLEVSYVFQPIFRADGSLYAYEALMRPHNLSVLDLIEQYETEDRLHVLEVATLFGVFQEYERRGLDKMVCINSFPSEIISEEENRIFNESFPESKQKGIIELLEYPVTGYGKWEEKKRQLSWYHIVLALDDFGTGMNDLQAVDVYKPNLVKLDRSLISNIDKEPDKQQYCKEMIAHFHEMNCLALGEGVETKEEMDYLISIGIDLLQGFYLGMPE